MPRGTVRETITGQPPDHSIPYAPAPQVEYPDISERGRWAIAYARAGWPVFPLKEEDKDPESLHGLLLHGKDDATTDPQTVAGWWRRAQDIGMDPNIGLLPDKGWLVIDIDAPQKVSDLLDRTTIASMGTAPFVRTGRPNGVHLYFRIPDGTDIGPISNRAWCDLKGDGKGYVVAPPSLHPNGTVYTWAKVCPIPALPDLVLKALGVTAPPQDEGALITIASRGFELPDSIGEGGRYGAIRDYVASRYKRGLSKEEIWALVRTEVAARMEVPLTEPELRERFDRAWRGTKERLGPPVQPVAPKPPPSSRIRSLGSFDMEKIDWLMRNWFSKGQITILEGWGGMSKSTVMVDLIARLTTGRALPSGEAMEGEPMDVLYITGEDDPAKVLLPRIMAADGDPDKVQYWTDDFVLPDDLKALDEVLMLNPQIGMVLIDPLYSHIDSEINTGRDTEVRRKVMDPLQDVAAKHGVCVVVARHLNKTTGASLGTKGSGSYGGLTGRARSVIAIIKDPENPDGNTKLFGVHKCNYGKMPKPLKFVIQDFRFSGTEGHGAENLDPSDTFPIVSWQGESNLTMDEAYDKLERQRTSAGVETRQQKADDALLRVFGDRNEMTREDAISGMAAEGYGRDATDAALARVATKVVVISGGANVKGGKEWVWRLQPSFFRHLSTTIGSSGRIGRMEEDDLRAATDPTAWALRRRRESQPEGMGFDD